MARRLTILAALAELEAGFGTAARRRFGKPDRRLRLGGKRLRAINAAVQESIIAAVASRQQNQAWIDIFVFAVQAGGGEQFARLAIVQEHVPFSFANRSLGDERDVPAVGG